ncbi:hypothetical protein BOX15_Mlig025652g2 [Macrostomum lignano]|uniref:RanBP2-type domain-containing protein n=1 Tax=Macrostomum lignano TaxID=282301 RepID=A0A267GVS6_9PLAT|nr:hypothetical protein BOX15_Mlig025652g2 [Macrostomum lignano]
MDSSTEQRLRVEFPHASPDLIRNLLQSGIGLEACRVALRIPNGGGGGGGGMPRWPPSSQPNLLSQSGDRGSGDGLLSLDTENLPHDTEMQRYLQPHSPLTSNSSSPLRPVPPHQPPPPTSSHSARSPAPSFAACPTSPETAHLSLQQKRLHHLQCQRRTSGQQLAKLQLDLSNMRDLLQALQTCHRNRDRHAAGINSDCCFDVLVNELRYELRRSCPPPPSLHPATSAAQQQQPPPLPPPRLQQQPSLTSLSSVSSNASSTAAGNSPATSERLQHQHQHRYLHQVSSPAGPQHRTRQQPADMARSAPQTPVVPSQHPLQVRQHQSIAEDDSAAAGAGAASTWQCHKCTFENHPDLKECEMCNTPKAPAFVGGHPFCIGDGCVCRSGADSGDGSSQQQGQQRVGEQPL